MPSPLTVKRNEYRKNRKPTDIETPHPLAKFIHDTVIQSKNVLPGVIFDIGCGRGNLSKPFTDDGRFVAVGIDTVSCEDRQGIAKFIEIDFLSTSLDQFYNDPFGIPEDTSPVDLVEMSSLVLCNPPFNNSGKGSRKLMPEVFMKRIFDVFGSDIPCVLFAPMGMLLNQRMKSLRWREMRDMEARITSTVSLPLDIFEGVEFHSQILLFNMPDLAPHYFLPEQVLTVIRSSRGE